MAKTQVNGSRLNICQRTLHTAMALVGLVGAEGFVFAASSKKAGKAGASLLKASHSDGLILKASGGGDPVTVKASVIKAIKLAVKAARSGNAVTKGAPSEEDGQKAPFIFAQALQEIGATETDFMAAAEILVREAQDRPATQRVVTLHWTTAGVPMSLSFRIKASLRTVETIEALKAADNGSIDLDDENPNGLTPKADAPDVTEADAKKAATN